MCALIWFIAKITRYRFSLKSNALLPAVDKSFNAVRLNSAFPGVFHRFSQSTSSRNGDIKINKPCLSRQIHLRESEVPHCVLLKGVSEILPKEFEKLMHASVVEIFLSATLRLVRLHIFLGRSHYNVVWLCMGKVSNSYGVHYRW